jgi:EAL domain-containing protein (putative c-di-GMP-specific phosphodiesterase class I)/CheY-like chemotaxis protein
MMAPHHAAHSGIIIAQLAGAPPLRAPMNSVFTPKINEFMGYSTLIGHCAPQFYFTEKMLTTKNPNRPQQTGDPGVAGSKPIAPLCLIIDDDPRIRHFLSLILQGAGVDAVEFAVDAASALDRQQKRFDIIFLNIGINANEAIATLEVLGKSKFSGAIQLMSAHGLVVLERLKRIGERHRLRMLPGLKKPFDSATVKKMLHAEKLGDRPAVAARIRLEEALKNGWIETWYQPKINLRKKQLAGCEAFARVRHPEFGVLPPSAFLPGADDATLSALAEQTLVKVMKAGLNFSQLGINLRIAVNMSMDQLVEVPITDIVSDFRPRGTEWGGLIIDVTEEQIVTNIGRASDIAKQFHPYNIRLAIDDFGRGVSSMMKVKNIPFAEMKLDRNFVTDCSADKVNAAICKSVIDLAHSLGGLAVGIGVERADDFSALVNMGCDLGQGYLLGHPMAEERFLALLKQRVATHVPNRKGPLPKRLR